MLPALHQGQGHVTGDWWHGLEAPVMAGGFHKQGPRYDQCMLHIHVGPPALQHQHYGPSEGLETVAEGDMRLKTPGKTVPHRLRG